MSILGLFNIGKSALFASQASLSVINNNIANVNTPGYARQDVVLQISNPIQGGGGHLIGAGVTTSGIRRSYDRFIEAQLTQQYQFLGRSTSLEKTLGGAEQIFNDASGAGLQKNLVEFFNAWQDVATAPEGQSQRIVLLQKAQSLVTNARRMESNLVTLLKQTNESIADMAGTVNTLATGISALNKKIVQLEAGLSSEQASDLRSQRDNLVNQLSELADISSFENRDGSLTVTLGMRNLVSGEKATPLVARTDTNGNTELSLDNINITALIETGQLGGLIAAREDIIDNSLVGLRKLVASLTKEINLQHQAGFGLDGSTNNNFFSPLQLATGGSSAGASITAAISDMSQVTLDEYDITFDATATNYTVTNRQTGSVVAFGLYSSGSTISFEGIDVAISGAITPQDSFSVSPLTGAVGNFGVALSDIRTIAASASAGELPGNSSNAQQVAQLADASIAALGGATFLQNYTGLVAHAGAVSAAASDSHTFDDSMLEAIRAKRESASGVSLDEEAANMIRFQRSYEAGARMIKITDELLQTILNL